MNYELLIYSMDSLRLKITSGLDRFPDETELRYTVYCSILKHILHTIVQNFFVY